jgi:ABC-2 type transport system ATP-binding protein
MSDGNSPVGGGAEVKAGAREAGPAPAAPELPVLSEDVVIETRDLTKVFADFWGRPKVTAVHKLNLSIRRGEVFGLLGPNGSGKTTTVKMLLGLLFPTSGQARVLGYRPGNVKATGRIGFLPEESYFYRFLDAVETLDFYGQLFRLPRKVRAERIRTLIGLVGLEGAARRPLREYSKGMMRRVGLAQALINDPDVVFLDEPTSGLDPIGNREIKDLILRLKADGKTVLLCSHLLADVEDVCDRIAILHRGELSVTGNMRDLLAQRDLTQVVTRRLSEGQLARLREVVGDDLISVEAPRTTLEELFLRVIKEQEGVGDPEPRPAHLS